MNDYEKRYFEKTQNVKPFDTGNSLHVYHEYYKIDNEIIKLYWAIGSDEKEPDIEIQSIKEFEAMSKIYNITYNYDN